MAVCLMLLGLLGFTPFTSSAQEQIPLIVKGDTITVVKSFPFSVEAPVGYHFYIWNVPDGVQAVKKINVLEVTKAPKGIITVHLTAAKIDFKAEKVVEFYGTKTFAIGDVPIPPDPGPDPLPPDPKPPTPIPFPGFRVMIVMETDTKEQDKLPPNQLAALHSQSVKSYLNAKCVMDESGVQKAWRLWDKDVDASAASPWAKAALERAKGKTMPWIIISNGTTGYEGPYPADLPKTMELLKKYGGE